MSEIMRPMPFGKLMNWMLCEYRQQGRIFGVHRDKFYQNATGNKITVFGQAISSPIGPAAGPGSQLAQNIVSAWLGGSRFIELKTVQKMDGDALRACVARPCINAEDEGYNVEWSTELTVQQAFDEYVKAWLAIHALTAKLGIAGGADVMFNMSVGYDLEGIKTPKIDAFIEGMKDASNAPVFKDGLAWLSQNGFEAVQAPAQVSRSVTLSTLHGCPPDEIERIANYLLLEKNVHTYIKCNPTLLGYETARRLLNEMGYGYVDFDSHHFDNDLPYGDAVPMLSRLMDCAAVRGLCFGVKITNTFPVNITAGTLPGSEMYMSGRALFPLSISVAAKLSRDFNGRLPISYSGGADAFNIRDIFKAGIQPITAATTLLKPGGYERLPQLAQKLEGLMHGDWDGIDVPALEHLAKNVVKMTPYRKESRPAGSRKTTVPLRLFDCFQAPCRHGGCPINQRIPEYLKLVSEKKFDEAVAVITADNALPGITGEICSHPCQGKCTRLDYDASLEIRAAKRLACKAAQKTFIQNLHAPRIQSGKKVAVVGAGPAGVATALYLRRAGFSVTVFEKRDKPFGIVEYVIPGFRISDDALARDFDMAQRMGVAFRFAQKIKDAAALRADYNYVVLAFGAWMKGAPAVRDGQEHTLDALDFLEKSKAGGCNVPLGRRVAVIGGGDVAMDCARSARRTPGVEQVVIVYRRTRAFMPAEQEEIKQALADGVELVELHAPLRYDGKTLCCEQMQLGAWESGGRRSVVGTGKEALMDFDSVICAVGARVDPRLYNAAGVQTDESGRPKLSAMYESSVPGVYVAGDCRGGPATVVQAMADAKRVTADICQKNGLHPGFDAPALPFDQGELYARKGVLLAARADAADGERCLGCERLCELCCDVCPNRANVRIPLPGFTDSAQILHIDGMCNECGNCGVFCPHSGKPYKDKLTLFWSEEDFNNSENRGFVRLSDGRTLLRLEDGDTLNCTLDDERVPRQMAAMIETVVRDYAYYL